MKRLFQSLGRRFRRLRIKRKVLLVYLTVGFLPFALFTIFLYGHTRHLIIDSEYGVRQSALNQAVQAVDATLEMYNTMSNYMFNEPSVLSALNRTYGDDYYAMYESYRDVITPVFNTHAALYPDLKRITIYTSCDILPYNTYVRDKSLLESAGWFMPLTVDYSPQWITLTQDAQTRLVCIRRIGMPSRYQYVNYLYLEVDYERTFEPLINLLQNGADILIADEDGRLLFSHPSQDGSLSYDASALLASGADDGRDVIRAPLNATGWTLYYVSGSDALFRTVTSATGTMYLVTWMLMIFLGCAALAFISSLLNPIEKLTQTIREIDQGNMQTSVSTTRTDEIGLLVHSFNDMMARIRQLVEITYKNELENKEYAQRLLRAQINPHFLYNSLSLINSKAIMAQQREISEMAMLLGKFYRSALNQGREVTTVRNELENIRSYISLQQMLSNGFFRAQVDVDDVLLTLKIPNFILQPIVENAIDHGLRNSPKDDRLLRLRITLMEDMLCFIVEDNGIGMDSQTLKALFDRHTNGYGLRNVDDRLRLIYGERYEMRIESVQDCGTTATLTMPAYFFT